MEDYTNSSEEEEQEFEIADGLTEGYPPFAFGMPGRGGRRRHGPPGARHGPMGGSFGPGAGHPPFGPGANHPPFGPGADHPPPPPHWGPEAHEHPHGRRHPYGPPHPHPEGPPSPPMPGRGRGLGKFRSPRNPMFRRGVGEENIYVFTHDFAPEELKVKLFNDKLTVTGKHAQQEAGDAAQMRRESMTHVYHIPSDQKVNRAGIKAKLVMGGAFLSVKIPNKKVQIPIERDGEPISEMEDLALAQD